MTRHIPEELNQQQYSCGNAAKLFFLYKDEMIIPHFGNNFLFIFKGPMKTENVQVWKKFHFLYLSSRYVLSSSSVNPRSLFAVYRRKT